jgi:hypothetical protein
MVFFVLFAELVNGQEIQIPEPQFRGVILMVLDSTTGIELDSERSYTTTNTKGVPGLGKELLLNVVDGLSSSIKASTSKQIRLIAMVGDNSINPSVLFNIFKLGINTKDKYRYVVIQSKKIGPVNDKTTKMNIDFKKFTAQKYGITSYLITIAEILEPGEYAVTIDGSRKQFNCFTVE